ncbi:hypothetical protein [Gorillibacterium massiliense]|uniref:hypothetical protein n=1 Tax=Gorillibacterium massiliense TaxID=1280390 RepID=UPI0004ADB947|nr:hypothetical protein [Gorillibacterium massiliense]
MSTYTRGNLAVKEIAKEQPAVQRRTQTNTQPARKKIKLSSGEKLFYLFCGLVMTVALSGVVLLTSQIYNVNKAVYETKNELQVANDENGRLKMDLDKTVNPEMLAADAAAGGFEPVKEEQKTSLNDNASNGKASAMKNGKTSGDES